MTEESPLVQHLRSHIRRHGSISFRDYMEAVLYHPEWGYYCSARNPIGRDGDFYTSSDVSPVFGKLLARKFAGFAEEFDRFAILELGAGKGLLARHILHAHPFRYLILERSPAMRSRQQELLAGFDVEWIEEIPQRFTGCIFSNEFFDALPVHRVIGRDGGLREIRVAEDFKEVEGPADASLTALDIPIAEGQRADINLDAREWIRRIGESLESGYHVAIDYGYLRREFFARPSGTLMCYWRHQAVEDPYVRVGEQDMTAHVNFSDLIDWGSEVSLKTLALSTQMQFLIDLGILDEMERLAATPTAESIARLQSLKTLLLPGGMGERYKVLVQRK